LENYKRNELVDHIFWFVLILFTNPGGILEAVGIGERSGGIHFSDFLFFILFGCFLLVHKNSIIYDDKLFRTFVKFLLLFLLYYLIVFNFFVPLFKNSLDYSFSKAFIKVRHGPYNILLVIMVYEFYLRSRKLFMKYFLASSLICMSLFIVSVFGGVEILTVNRLRRNFVQVDRLFMISYGIMPILISMGSVLLIFNFKIKNKFWIVLASLMMYLMWILAIIRREIFGTIIFIFLMMVYRNYLMHRILVPVKKMISGIVVLTGIIFALNFTFPDYVNAGYIAAQETVSILTTGKTKSGSKDVRMGLGKDFMQNRIKENYIFGTGFDNRWRTREGDDQGFEAADYPFLAAIAMNGIIGILFFLPIYWILIKAIRSDIQYLRRIKLDLTNSNLYLLIVFTGYFIFDFLQYFNWFLPMSLFLQSEHKRWYIWVGLYFAIRRIYYENRRETNSNLVLDQ